MNLPIDITRLPREATVSAPFETPDGQPFDLYWWNDEARGEGREQWHRVTSLTAQMYSGFAPWLTLVCQPDNDDCWNVTAQDYDLSTTVPTEDLCPECFPRSISEDAMTLTANDGSRYTVAVTKEGTR